MFKLAVVIGRFSAPHLGHVKLVQAALDAADHVLVLIGSSGEASVPRNPWSYLERVEMWELAGLNYDDMRNRITIRPLHDHLYNNNAWIAEVQSCVNEIDHENSVVVVGCDKDETSWYLKVFPQWKRLDPKVFTIDNEEVHATTIREKYFLEQTIPSNLVPPQIETYLRRWMTTTKYENIRNEMLEAKAEAERWAGSPYPVIFQTVDSVVVQSGHILLIQRGEFPQKGAWALPGGYLNVNETLLEGALRELDEETKIKVPKKVLEGSITKTKVYDYPKRSIRGRIITNAFLISLKDDITLPKVKGSDDAKLAKWIPIVDVLNMRDQFFEDHYHIVRDMIDI